MHIKQLESKSICFSGSVKIHKKVI
ncbi:IS1 family transposase [Xenorhabdus bovienii]|nr:IS1 family transposase [Xenorhabdus bovienii]MDE9470798.1 IS1 family transposase [Xenorhabdus bovienii]